VKPFTPRPDLPAAYDLRACAFVQATTADLPELRANLVPPALLKHADEQTVVGVAAVLRAVREAGLPPDGFGEWGVVAAPRFLGRAATAAALQRFRAEGAWGVSPHLIPHRSLHSLSGTVSLALKAHGPNFGTGGGPEGPDGALLAAAALLADAHVPGVWVVLTGWHPEPVPTEDGQVQPPDAVCSAVALALTWPGARPARLRLRLATVADADAGASPFSLEALLQFLIAAGPLAATVVWRSAWGGSVSLERAAAARRAAGLGIQP
jgi:hypothetical protein